VNINGFALAILTIDHLLFITDRKSSFFSTPTKFLHVRFEVFTATLKNGVFWDVRPCGSCKNRRFGGSVTSEKMSFLNFP
jgi:hypothetical protein